MNPLEFEQLLPAYADDQLTPEQRAQVEAHLDAHPEVRVEVIRVQALRAAVQRILAASPVPAGLTERVRTRLRHSTLQRGRILRLGLSGLAAVAALALAVTYWPQRAQATPFEAQRFANIYRRCALHEHHRAYGLSATGALTTADALGQVRAQAPFASRAPDLSCRGEYDLDGACPCGSGKQLKMVHLYFRDRRDPSHVVSVFAADRTLELCEGGKPCSQCAALGRPYRTASDNGVTIVCWSEGERGYAMACGRLSREQLIQLAEDARTVAGAPAEGGGLHLPTHITRR